MRLAETRALRWAILHARKTTAKYAHHLPLRRANPLANRFWIELYLDNAVMTSIGDK